MILTSHLLQSRVSSLYMKTSSALLLSSDKPQPSARAQIRVVSLCGSTAQTTVSLSAQPSHLLENITALKWKPQIPRKESASEELGAGMFIIHIIL